MADAQTSLFENKMLMSILSGAGASVGGEGSFAASLNPLIQQTIGAQSQAGLNQQYLKMLTDILGGNVPRDGKLEMTEDGLIIKAPKSALEGPIQQPQPGTFTTTPAPAPIPAPSVKPTDIPGQEWQQFLNPLSSQLPNITASDVAGLTSQDVSRALSGALSTVGMIEGIKSKKFSALVDQMYKEGLMKYYESQAETGKIKADTAQIARLTELTKQFRLAPLNVPGLGKLDLETWKSLDTKTKEYSFYVFNAQQKDEEIMSFNEWDQQADDPTAKELYDIAVDELGKETPFGKWLVGKYRPSGAPKISIGEREDIKHIKYFSDPEGLSADISKYMESNIVQDTLIQLEGRAKSREGIKLTVKFIEGKIAANIGEITDVRMDGKIRVWTVKWPNGMITEVRHAF